MADTKISPQLKSHFLNLYSMMMADMEVSPLEKAELYRIGREEFDLSSEDLDKLVISDEILFYIPESDKDQILYLYDMALMAWADGKIEKEERYLLKQNAKKFGFDDSEIDELTQILLDKAQQKLTHEQIIKDFFE